MGGRPLQTDQTWRQRNPIPPAPQPQAPTTTNVPGLGDMSGGMLPIAGWDPAHVANPYSRDIYQQARALYQNADPYVGANPYQTQAYDLMAQRAIGGSPLLGAANNQLLGTLRGDYLNANPYLDQTFQQAARGIVPNINSTFSLAGRYGSNAHQTALGSGLADLATNIYGGNYQQERGRQMSMLGYAQPLANQAYTDYSMLGQAGAGLRGFAQEQAMAPYNRLSMYQGFLPGAMQTTPQYTNSGAGMLGGAIGGGVLGSQFGPWGMAGGAILGGILGRGSS